MPDSPSISNLFGRFRTLGARLDDLESRIGGGEEVGQTLSVSYWTGEEIKPAQIGDSFYTIELQESSDVMTIGDAIEGEGADEDGFFLLSNSGGYQIHVDFIARIVGADFLVEHPNPVRGMLLVELIDDPEAPSFPPPGIAFSWTSIPRADHHDIVMNDHDFAIVGAPANEFDPALGRYFTPAYRILLDGDDDALDVVTEFDYLRVTLVRTIAAESLIEELR